MSWSVFAPVPLYALYRVISAVIKGDSVSDVSTNYLKSVLTTLRKYARYNIRLNELNYDW